MTKIGFCSNCGRTVYLGSSDDEKCPVCSSRVVITSGITNETAARIGANEAMFREINEAIERIASSGRHEDAEFQCECGNAGCMEAIVVTRDIYDTVRKHTLRFLVRAGHEMPEAEKVIETHEGFSVVEKVGAGAEVAKETDPRSR